MARRMWLLMAMAVMRPGMLGAWAIVAASFFLSIMFPTIFALGLKGLGENTKLGGSMLVMAIVGGAFFPLLLGKIADVTGSMALGYLVPLVCFAGVGVYGFVAPLILPPPGMTDPEAGVIVAEYGQGYGELQVAGCQLRVGGGWPPTTGNSIPHRLRSMT